MWHSLNQTITPVPHPPLHVTFTQYCDQYPPLTPPFPQPQSKSIYIASYLTSRYSEPVKLLNGSDILHVFFKALIPGYSWYVSLTMRLTIPIELTRPTKETSLGSPEMLPFKSDWIKFMIWLGS